MEDVTKGRDFPSESLHSSNVIIRKLSDVLFDHVFSKAMLSYEEFERVDIRVGTVIAADPFPEARKPAYKLTIDFGEYGVQAPKITKVYSVEELVGKQVIAVVNFPPKQIGPFISECLVCGFDRTPGEVVLAQPGLPVPNGTQLY